jgi:hypothetical protein
MIMPREGLAFPKMSMNIRHLASALPHLKLQLGKAP